MNLPAIHFVGRNLSERWSDYRDLTEADLLRDPDRFKGGTINWIFQTYLRLGEPLEKKGYGVSFGEGLKPGCINIAHRDSLNRWLTPYYRSYVVGVRADRPPVKVCDWEIVQNRLGGMRACQTDISHWPQPGLLPRNSERGTSVEHAAYFGRTGTTSRWLREAAFKERLQALGVTFTIEERAWSDYRAIDVVIAHRNEAPTMLMQKPASKLINAWLAGVPALLNREPAFEDLRRSPLDYLQIDSPDDVVSAIRQLKESPQLYEAMVRNGEQRAREYTINAIRDRWLWCIEDLIVPDAMKRLGSPREGLFAHLEQGRRLIFQKMLAKQFKWHYSAENRRLQSLR
jgi:hypothetical protein